MAHADWRSAADCIIEATSAAGDDHYRLAVAIGCALPPGLPRLVAAARLRTALAGVLDLPAPDPTTEAQQSFVGRLATEAGVDIEPPQDAGELNAWYRFLRLRARLAALGALRPEADDVVEVTDAEDERLEIVASIGDDGRVFFRGGQDAGAWPDQLVVRCRRNDASKEAARLRREARNAVAGRARLRRWSDATKEELRQFAVDSELTVDVVDELEDVLRRARDERPLQHLIGAHPELLTGVMAGTERYCIPQKRFGAEHIPDFLLGDVNSLGIRWLLVELETPKSAITLKTRPELEKHARQGVAQIQSWREWLQHNLDYATRSRRQHGLGLVNIRPATRGLVLVGRRALLREGSAGVRYRLREENGIDVHTYDWLVERVRGTLRFSGPPAGNPNLLDFGSRGAVEDDVAF